MTGPNTIRLYENTIGGLIRKADPSKAAASHYYDPFPIVYEFELDPRVAEILQKQPVLHQRLRDAALPIIEAQIRTSVSAHVERDSNTGSFSAQLIEAQLKAGANPISEKLNSVLSQQMASERGWSEYRNNNIKEYGKIFILLGVSAIGFVTAPTGVGLAGGILGLVNGVLDGISAAVTSYKKVEDANAELMEDMLKLASSYKSKASGRAKQITAGVADAVAIGKIAKMMGKSVPSFKEIDEDIKVCRGKLDNLNTFIIKISSRLTETLNWLELHDKFWDDKNVPEEVINAREKVKSLLENGVSGRSRGIRGKWTISALNDRYQDGLQALAKIEAKLPAIKALEPRAHTMEVCIQISSGLVGIATSFMNYQPLLSLTGHQSVKSLAAALGLVGSTPIQDAASSMGVLADIYGTVGEIKEMISTVRGADSEENKNIAKNIKNEFQITAFSPGQNGPPVLPLLVFPGPIAIF